MASMLRSNDDCKPPQSKDSVHIRQSIIVVAMQMQLTKVSREPKQNAVAIIKSGKIECNNERLEPGDVR